jgi:transcriptional regulator with XRE-family HTH domain
MKKTETKFGERLRVFRKRSGLTTQEVAKTCLVAESTYREWEYGREIRGVRPYEALARAFQISLTELILGEKGTRSSIDEDLRAIEEIIKSIRLKLE